MSNSTVPFHFPLLQQRVESSLRALWHGSMPESLLVRAVREAAEQAQGTGFPLLLFPVLAEETVRAVHASLYDSQERKVA